MEQEKIMTETDQMYLEQIEALKLKMENEMVDKEEFEKLQAQHKKLLDEYINKRPVETVKPEVLRSAAEIAKELTNIKNGNMTNRDYVKTSLEYREAHIRETGLDPWADFGPKGPGKPNEETEEVANAFKAILEENEDPVSFRIKMNSVLEDDNVLLSKIRNRK